MKLKQRAGKNTQQPSSTLVVVALWEGMMSREFKYTVKLQV